MGVGLPAGRGMIRVPRGVIHRADPGTQIALDVAPFQMRPESVVIREISQGTKPVTTQDLGGLSTGLRSLLERCWAVAPTDRPTASECSQALTAEAPGALVIRTN